jgi:hypothetical protein
MDGYLFTLKDLKYADMSQSASAAAAQRQANMGER